MFNFLSSCASKIGLGFNRNETSSTVHNKMQERSVVTYSCAECEEARSTLTTQTSRTMHLVVGYFSSEELARKAVIELLQEVGCYGKHNFDLKSGYYKD